MNAARTLEQHLRYDKPPRSFTPNMTLGEPWTVGSYFSIRPIGSDKDMASYIKYETVLFLISDCGSFLIMRCLLEFCTLFLTGLAVSYTFLPVLISWII